MIVYMANERQVDFIALYMKAGRIVYMFNCGSGPARLTSAGAFNDGEWHTVRRTTPSRLTESTWLGRMWDGYLNIGLCCH